MWPKRVVEVESICRAARRFYAVDHTREVVSLLAPEIADETSVGVLAVRPGVIDARHLEIVRVRPGLLDEEVLRKVGRGRPVRLRIKTHDRAGDRIEPVGRNQVSRKRIPRHDAVDEARGVRDRKSARPTLSSSEKSPVRIFAVGTELVNDSTVSSCSFS